MKKKLLLSVVFVGAVAALAALTGCERGAVAAGPPPEPPPPQVTVATVTEKEIVEWEEFTGRAGPVESVEIRPRVSGYIREVRFQSGQLVKKGDILFVIDPRWHEADYERLQAEAEKARVDLDNAKREADRT